MSLPQQDTAGVSPLVLNEVEQWCIENDPNITDETLQKLQESRPPEELSRGQWYIDSEGTTRAIISMCIKNNLKQTLSSLIMDIARDKQVSFTEAAGVLCAMRRNRQLGYYHAAHDGHYEFASWVPPDLPLREEQMLTVVATEHEPSKTAFEVLPANNYEEAELRGEPDNDRFGANRFLSAFKKIRADGDTEILSETRPTQ